MMDFSSVLTWPNIERLLFGNLFVDGSMGGLLLTLVVGALSIVGSTLLGAVVGLMRNAGRAYWRLPALVYIQILRSVPVLILVFWVYFIPPQLLGFEVSPIVSAVLALTLFTSAYIAEIVMGGLRSIPQGQIEASRVLGLSRWQTQLHVVLPQAFHAMLPVLAGRYVVVIKDTSLAFLIGLADLTDIGRQIDARLMTSPMAVYLTLIAMYFVVNRLISRCMHLLESRERFNRLFVRL
ncbi:amino acid ABC transporter permease [Burkholderia sp. WAC0059]|uniref:amino acid ABC transporter permease n=1 Tax=Burkholderia sp. WAC0059 TaxID=2066022 RepID=UPI000C7F4747|nr:amino acid ABC transporter permease [Burkholderia sp. WAC0059]PLZ02392.1 amino acid ABC transporter permease [Burkholderia sp. WAC0059]